MQRSGRHGRHHLPVTLGVGRVTVGAVTDAGQTQLEGTLAELTDASRVFRAR